jgi:hypothetical protein
MGFFFFLLYLATFFIFPGELFPQLAPYKITFWMGVTGLVISVITLAPTGKLTLRALPIGLLTGLTFSMILSVMWADRWPGAPLYVIEEFGPVVALFLLAVWNVTTLRRLRITAVVVVSLMMVLVVEGVAAYHFGFMQDTFLWRPQVAQDDQDEPVTAEDASVRLRSLGQMNDPNDFALVLVATVPLLALAWRRGRVLRNTVFWGVPAVFMIYGIYLTRSRGGMMGLLAGSFASIAGRLSRTKAILATVAIAALFMATNFTAGRAISTSEESAAGRVAAWSEGLDMFKSSPFLGIGYQHFTEYNELTAHNSYVLCFSELGLLGYFFWLALLVVAIRQLQNVRRSTSNDLSDTPLRRYANALLASFTGTLVAAFFLSRSYHVILYLLVALAFATYTIARDTSHPDALLRILRLGRSILLLEFASIIAMYIFVRVNHVFGQ